VKEIDDTPPESESECPDWFKDWLIKFQDRVIQRLSHKVESLEKRIMNLEQRKVANENNQKDPEWY